MAEVINYGGRKYIKWTATFAAPTGYIPLPPAKFAELQNRVASVAPTRIESVTRPTLAFDYSGRPVEIKVDQAATARSLFQFEPNPVRHIDQRRPPLDFWRSYLGPDAPGIEGASVVKKAKPKKATRLKRKTVQVGPNKYRAPSIAETLADTGRVAGQTDSAQRETVPEEAADMMARLNEGRSPTRAAKAGEALVEFESVSNEIDRLRFMLEHGVDDRLDKKTLQVQLRDANRRKRELAGVIKANRVDLHTETVVEGMKRRFGDGHRYEPPPVLDDLFADDPIRTLDMWHHQQGGTSEASRLARAYDDEMKRQRMAMSTTRRYFRTDAARFGDMAQMDHRGPRAHGLVELGDYVEYDGVKLAERVASEHGSHNIGIYARDIDIMPAPILDQLTHRVVRARTIEEHALAPVRPELLHASQSFMRERAWDTEGDVLSSFEEEADHISRMVSERFQDAFDQRTAGTIVTDAMRADLETAKSLYLGTLYKAPSARDAERFGGFSLSETGASTAEQMRSIVIDRKEDNFLRDLLFDVAPELREEAERKGKTVARSKLPWLLERSAGEMRIPSRKGLAKAVQERVRSKRMIRTAERRMLDYLDAPLRQGQENEFATMLDLVDSGEGSATSIASMMSDLPMEQDDFVSGLLEELSKKRATYGKKKPPAGLERAIAMAGELSHKDLALAMANMNPMQMAAYGLDEEMTQAYRFLSQAADATLDGGIPENVGSDARRFLMDTMPQQTRQEAKAASIAEKVEEALSPIRKRTMRRAIAASGASDSDAAILSDLITRSTRRGRGRRMNDPFIGLSKEEIVSNLGELAQGEAQIRVGIAGDRNVAANLILENIMPVQGDNGPLNAFDVFYRVDGSTDEVIRTLVQAGVHPDDAAVMADQRAPVPMRQRYTFQGISPEGVDFKITPKVLEGYEEEVTEALKAAFPQESPAQIRLRVRDEMASFRTQTPERMREIIEGRPNMGRFVATANPEVIMDLQSETFVERMVRSAHDGRNTVTASNARYTDGLISRIFEMQSPYGSRYLGKHGDKSLFGIATDADGNKQLVINELFDPNSRPHESLAMDDTVRSVLDEITVKLGGIDKVEEMVKASSVDKFDLPRSVLDEVMGERRTDGVFVDTTRHTTGPLSAGARLDIPYNAPKEMLDQIEQTYGIRPENEHFGSSLGEVFAEALHARREEMSDGAPPRQFMPGVEPEAVPTRSSRIIDDMIVKPAREHMDTLKDERIVQHMSPEQAEAFGVRRVAETAEEGAEHMSKSGFKLATMEDVGKLFKENKSVRYGAVAVSGLALWGAYRNHRTKQDHTFEDQRGPAHLPGGSPYENPPQGFTNENTPSFASQSGGVTYHVDARGQFDPNALATAMNSHVGGSIQMNIQHSPDPIRQRSQKMEDMINGY